MQRDQQPMRWRKFKVKALNLAADCGWIHRLGFGVLQANCQGLVGLARWRMSSSYVLAWLALTACTYLNAGWMRVDLPACLPLCPFSGGDV